MRKILLVLLFSLGLATVSGWSSAASPRKSAPAQSAGKTSAGAMQDRFVGTWKLVGIEQRNAQGALLPPAQPALASRVGFLIYDAAGYMGVAIMPSGRQKYAGAQPTSEEAKAALTGYAAYFGTFTINEAERFVTHHLQGSLSPNMGADQKRFFEMSGNRLTLKPPPGATGNQSRLTWERVPDVTTLSPAQRRFIGFWKLVSNERRNTKGQLVSSNPGQTGYIIYTASGYMMVHMMRPDRKKYAAAQPAPDEAAEALRTYTNYFGPYTLHEAERYVVHHRIGLTNPGQVGSDAQRFYEFSGTRLMLRPPPATLDGQQVQGTITWERVSGDNAPASSRPSAAASQAVLTPPRGSSRATCTARIS